MFRKLAKYTLVLINAFFALLYIFGLLALYVPTDRFVWFSYFGLIFPLLVIVQVCFAIFWAIKRKWWVLMPLLLLAFSYKSVNNAFSMPIFTKKADDGQKITIVSYNVSFFGGEKHLDDIVKLIEKKNADIVCLQEFGFYKKSNALNEEKILSRFKKNYPYRHIWYKNQTSRIWWGNATFSKFPIVKKQKVDYASKNNVSIFSDIKIGRDTVRVFNSHLETTRLTKIDLENLSDASTRDNKAIEQASQKLNTSFRAHARQARKIAEIKDPTPYPTIVCGDFNDVAQSYTYHTLARGMLDAVNTTHWGYNYTFRLKNILPIGIDHILVDEQKFTPTNSHIVHVDFSDHFPVVAQLIIDN